MISTSYAFDSKKVNMSYQTSLFETQAPQFNPDINKIKGKIFTLDHDTNMNGVIDIDDLEWQYLEGDGDFRSNEVRKLRNEADFIITNPPFSLFREFLAWITEADKKFVIVGNKNCITYKEMFSLIKNNKMWCAARSMSEDMLFSVPCETAEYYLENEKEGSKYRIVNGKVLGRSASLFFTNIEHGRRHNPLQLMTMERNIKHSKHKEVRGHEYKKYDNYDAIEVPYTDAIPSDYKGVMGVPISFPDKYCPEQFEIIWTTDRGGDGMLEDLKKKHTRYDAPVVDNNGLYKRIFIRHKES